jgi:hypothetical protein
VANREVMPSQVSAALAQITLLRGVAVTGSLFRPTPQPPGVWLDK